MTNEKKLDNLIKMLANCIEVNMKIQMELEGNLAIAEAELDDESKELILDLLVEHQKQGY